MDFKYLNKKFKENYKTFDLNFDEQYILNIILKRSDTMNSCNFDYFNEFIDVFTVLNYNNYKDIRVIILKSSSNNFCSGLDLKETAPKLFVKDDTRDQARNSLKFKKIIEVMQKSFFLIEECNIPVIVCIKGYCIGAGIDLILACDIIISEENSKFSIKEVNIGLAADLGTLQRLPLFTNNWGLMNELIYTGRFFNGIEAHKLGIVSFLDKNVELKANNIAKSIIKNSPVAVAGSKMGVNFYKKKIVKKGLEIMKFMNMSLLFTDDVLLSINKNNMFPKL